MCFGQISTVHSQLTRKQFDENVMPSLGEWRGAVPLCAESNEVHPIVM